MKRFISLLLFVCLFASLALSISAETLSSTLVRSSSADPWICTDGEYYYLATTGSTRVPVFRSKTISGLYSQSATSNIVYDSAYDPTVEELFGRGATLSGTWSPEIHYFSEDVAPGYSGWYMLLALRNNTGDSSQVKMVVLKSVSGTPKGPYGHPVTGKKNHSQPLLDAEGNIYDNWGVGQSSLKISEGPYKGIYTTWVTEVYRGTSNFHQMLMIAKMINPWTVGSDPCMITKPTQSWEETGSGWSGSKYMPAVVEGATALYGTRGDVYITYSGSGYWSDYGLGQITWTGGDPLETSSWVKLPDSNRKDKKITSTNPIFRATKARAQARDKAGEAAMIGAGHASFITDKEGNGFLCYHGYPYQNGQKAKGRSAFIEPYYIDYTEWNGTSYGVLHFGAADSGEPASITDTKITFATVGNELEKATVKATSGKEITLQMTAQNADSYMIYRGENGQPLTYLTTTKDATYMDTDIQKGVSYSYRVYSCREEEVGEPSAIVSAEYATVYTVEDVSRMLRYIVGDTAVQSQPEDDKDNNGTITLADALRALKEIVNK